MSWALIGVIGALSATLAVLAGAAWWFGKRGFDAMDTAVAESKRVVELKEALGEQRLAQERTHETLKKVIAERDRQRDAREALREQLETALDECSHDPGAAARSIRATLGRLRDLAEEVPDVPEDPTPDDGDGD